MTHTNPIVINTERFVHRLNTLAGAQNEYQRNNPALIDETNQALSITSIGVHICHFQAHQAHQA